MGNIRKYAKHTYWTDEEEKLLRSLSKTKTSIQIAEIMGRTKCSVECKRQRMLIDSCMSDTDRIIAKQVGRLVGQHEKSIYNRWRKAGLPLRRLGAHYYSISEKMLVKFMQEHHELWRASQCDYDFFCRYDWFLDRLKAERDGTDTISHYRNRREWTPYELSRVKMLWQRGRHYTEIAKEVGRSKMAVYHKVRLLEEERKNND